MVFFFKVNLKLTISWPSLFFPFSTSIELTNMLILSTLYAELRLSLNSWALASWFKPSLRISVVNIICYYCLTHHSAHTRLEFVFSNRVLPTTTSDTSVSCIWKQNEIWKRSGFNVHPWSKQIVDPSGLSDLYYVCRDAVSPQGVT